MRLAAPLTVGSGIELEPKVLACKRAGYSTVQIHFASEPTQDLLSGALTLCEREKLNVSAFGCYANPLHRSVRASHGVSAEDVAVLVSHLPEPPANEEPWRIVTFSGTLSGQLATPHPGNRTPGALFEVKNWARELLPALKEH